MGEIAEAVIDGCFCYYCGEFLDGKRPGYVRYCSEECRERHNLNVYIPVIKEGENNGRD